MRHLTTGIAGRPVSSSRRALLAAGAVYLVWVLATFLLEGRISLLSRPDPLGHALYAVVVYVIGRDIYPTIIIHNFLGMVGIIASAEPAPFRQPLYPLYVQPRRLGYVQSS